MRPQARLLLLLIFVFTISMLHSLKVISFLFLLTVVFLIGNFLKLKTSLIKATPVIVTTFLIGLPLALSFFSPGKELFSISPSISITYVGLMNFLRFFLRVCTIVLIVSYYLATYGEMEFMKALRGLRLPSEVILLFYIAIRNISIFVSDYKDFLIAKKIRTIKYSGTWDNIKWTALKSGILVDKAFKSAIESSYGLTLRLTDEKIIFQGSERMKRKDIISIFLALFVSVLVLVVDRECR